MTFILLLIISIFLNNIKCATIKCVDVCTFSGQYYDGANLKTLPKNELCFTDINNSSYKFNIEKEALGPCYGLVTVPADLYCPVIGQEMCQTLCGCKPDYFLCVENVKIKKKSNDFVCYENDDANPVDVLLIDPCSPLATELCPNHTCSCKTCKKGEYRLPSINRCGYGYYECIDTKWNYNEQSNITLCDIQNKLPNCYEEPYCQIPQPNCYNTIDDTPFCNLPTNNTCVQQCVDGRGYWSCNNGKCSESYFNGTQDNTIACYNDNGTALFVNLTVSGNLCNPTTTNASTESTTETTTESTTQSTTETTTESTTQSNTTVSTTTPSSTTISDTTQIIPIPCPFPSGQICFNPLSLGFGYLNCDNSISSIVPINRRRMCIQIDYNTIFIQNELLM